MRARENPFRSDRLSAVRYRLREGTWAGLLERLESLRYRAAIVGPRGSGKTTLLGDLAARLRGLGFEPRMLFLNEEAPRFEPGSLERLIAEVGARHVVLFDGAEQLGPLGWARFRRSVRRAGGLVVTSHRRGLLPTLVRCTTSEALLVEIVGELVGAPPPELCEAARVLYDRHGGNVREALAALYDLYARLPDPARIAVSYFSCTRRSTLR